MISYLGQLVVQNGATTEFYRSQFEDDQKTAINIPPFTCLFFEDVKAKKDETPIGEYRVFVPRNAIYLYKSTVDENCECLSGYGKEGDWIRLPNGKSGALWVYLYAVQGVVKGYLAFRNDIPNFVQEGIVDALKVCDVPKVPTVNQRAAGVRCPAVVNGFIGKPIVVPQEIVQHGVFDIVKEADSVRLVNPFCMIGDLLSSVDVSGFTIIPNKVLAVKSTVQENVLMWFDSVLAMQNAQDESYDAIITPLYKFGEDGETEIDFRGIPSVYLWR